MNTLVEDKVYAHTDFRASPLAQAEYDHCSFNDCDFSGTDLSGRRFIDCAFTECNLSLVKLSKTALRDVAFNGCKMLGLRFDTCHPFGVAFRFENCILNDSVFVELALKGTLFAGTELTDVDFTGCDLTEAVFSECNLMGATFAHTVLEKADLRTAHHYTIDPELNRIKKARFSLPEVVGLLRKYDIDISLPD